jgi:hypothetical protein
MAGVAPWPVPSIPIPYCGQLQIPSEMFAYSAQKEELGLLGRGTLFGSLWQKEMVELRLGDLANVEGRRFWRLIIG